MSELVVTYKSEILGEGEFWRGPVEELDKIRNLPARELAKQVASDGRQRTLGMWTVARTSISRGKK